MKKKTKRKAFNFLRSYFDVLNELTNDKDKLDFLTAIINKQFLNEDPNSLNFLVNLCYESQRHQIETSVKGWERATKDSLNTTSPTTPGTTPPTTLGTDPKEEEEEEKEEVKDIHTKFDFKKSCVSLGIELDIVKDWLIVRKGKKASNTKTAFELIKSELSKTTLPANECIRIAVENSWSGFKADWLKTVNLPINKPSGEDEYMNNVMKQFNANKLL